MSGRQELQLGQVVPALWPLPHSTAPKLLPELEGLPLCQHWLAGSVHFALVINILSDFNDRFDISISCMDKQIFINYS